MDAVASQPRVHEDLTARSIPPHATISFRHPAYADSDDVLFKLPRLDFTEDGTTSGVHHRTALQACQIVANNAFHGYLSTDRDGQDAVTVAPDGLLTNDNYWFIVNRRDDDDEVEQREGRDVYPIVPSFDEWAFPHTEFSTLGWDVDVVTTSHLPSPSRATSPATSTTFAVPATPQPNFQRCILSNHAYSICKAHLVPSANLEWFRVNNMKRYEDEQHSRRSVHNNRNVLPIRYDLHTVWDAYAFALVPKRGQLVAHVLTAPSPGSREFAAEWHNRPVQRDVTRAIGKPYLFAKFAQAVFVLLKPFVACSPAGKYVARLQATDGQRDEHKVRKEWLSGKSLEALYSGGGSRKASASPSSSRKRSRSQASPNDADCEEEEEWQPRHTTKRIRLWADECWADESEGEPDDGACRGSLSCASEDGLEHTEERGRPRSWRQRYGRSEHTVDTLPSLTDTSVVDVEEEHLDDSWSADEPSNHPLKPPDKHLCESSLLNEDEARRHVAK